MVVLTPSVRTWDPVSTPRFRSRRLPGARCRQGRWTGCSFGAPFLILLLTSRVRSRHERDLVVGPDRGPAPAAAYLESRIPNSCTRAKTPRQPPQLSHRARPAPPSRCWCPEVACEILAADSARHCNTFGERQAPDPADSGQAASRIRRLDDVDVGSQAARKQSTNFTRKDEWRRPGRGATGELGLPGNK